MARPKPGLLTMRQTIDGTVREIVVSPAAARSHARRGWVVADPDSPADMSDETGAPADTPSPDQGVGNPTTDPSTEALP